MTLPAGQQVLTIAQDNGGWNGHSLAFAAQTDQNVKVALTQSHTQSQSPN